MTDRPTAQADVCPTCKGHVFVDVLDYCAAIREADTDEARRIRREALESLRGDTSRVAYRSRCALYQTAQA